MVMPSGVICCGHMTRHNKEIRKKQEMPEVFDPELFATLQQEFHNICHSDPIYQAEIFLTRFLSPSNPNIGLFTRDSLHLYNSLLPHTQRDPNPKLFTDFSHQNFHNFLLSHQRTNFASALVRNQQLSLINPGLNTETGSKKVGGFNLGAQAQSFSLIEFLCYVYLEEVLNDHFERYKIPKEDLVSKKKFKMLKQIVWNEVLNELPMNEEAGLEDLIREERTVLKEGNEKISKLMEQVALAEAKQQRGEILGIKEKRAMQEMEIIRQNGPEEKLANIRRQIKSKKNKLKRLQKNRLKDWMNGIDFENTTQGQKQMVIQGNEDIPGPPQTQTSADEGTLPPGWVAYVDDNSGYTYYHNATLNLTQWEKP
eukprot:augustus_masked-scaffold_30-processed-gene-0.1-mRNA-1 protein AED:0.06 eAED:1.00 QI:0/-1/0/1/-1/1/1/0/367